MIKMFNEYYNNRIGKQVSYDKFMDKKSLFKMIDLTDYERKKLYEISDKKGYRISLSSEYAEFNNSWLSIELVKYEDDWFTLIVSDRYSINTYYICDEFEEAVGLLSSSL